MGYEVEFSVVDRKTRMTLPTRSVSAKPCCVMKEMSTGVEVSSAMGTDEAKEANLMTMTGWILIDTRY